MSTARRLYGRVEEWARNLSRLKYALVVGLTTAIGILVISSALREARLFDAVLMGITMTTVYYVLDPQ